MTNTCSTADAFQRSKLTVRRKLTDNSRQQVIPTLMIGSHYRRTEAISVLAL